MKMKAIRRPLIYFLIWITACLCILFPGRNGGIVTFMLCGIVSVIIYIIAYYHIIVSSDRVIKEKEPKLYSELEMKFKGIRPELNAVSILLFSGGMHKYPALRLQLVEFIAFLVFTILGFIIFAIIAFSVMLI